MRTLFKKIKNKLEMLAWKTLHANKPKVFCIGRNKTGTTSVELVLKEFGYKMGNQTRGELLLNDYKNKNWEAITNFCQTAQGFQDVPFSWPETWKHLYKKYPNAKFILTYRNDEDWYQSITKFHSKLFADGKRIPTKEDLQKATYRYKGYIWESNMAVYNTPENDPYQKDILIKNYNTHNTEVLAFFNDKKNFLAIDVSENESYNKLCLFLDKKPMHKNFPHLNRTADK